MDKGITSRSGLYPFRADFTEYVPSGDHVARATVLLLLGTTVLYGLFQKKLLPHGVSKVASKFLFWPTLPITLALRYGNLFTAIDDTVILGTAPVGFLGHPQELYDKGVRGVINMCTEYAGPQDAYMKLGIKQLRLPTVDHFEPSFESMKDGVEFIKEFQKRGEKVYIHCKAGHGRAASVALCYYMNAHPELSAEECNSKIYKIRKVRPTLFKQKNVKRFKELVDTRVKLRK